MTSAGPTGGPNGDVDATSSVTIHPTGSGRIELHASRFWGAAATSWQDISVDEARQSIDVGLDSPTASCNGTVLTATATVSGFGASSTVTGVVPRAGDKHAYKVRHNGTLIATIDPATPTPSPPALARTQVTGSWQLEATLLPAEVCGQPSLPSNLGVDVLLTCDGAAR